MELKRNVHISDTLFLSRWELVKLFFGKTLSTAGLKINPEFPNVPVPPPSAFKEKKWPGPPKGGSGVPRKKT